MQPPRPQQSDPERPASPQPGIHTTVGFDNQDSGCIRRSGNITIPYSTSTVGGSRPAQGEDLERLAKGRPALSARAVKGNIGCSKIEDSGNLVFSDHTGSDA